MTSTRRTGTTNRRVAALAVVVAVVASSCVFGDRGANGSGTVSAGLDAVESGLDGSGSPQRGGQLVYGLEAEANKGYCLPQSELAISGMQVARAMYDTLTVPDAKGGYAPYLAKAITPSDDHRTWTITLRSASPSTTGPSSTPRWSRTTSTPTGASTRPAPRCCSASCSPTSNR